LVAASEDQSGSLDALKYSMASDIVELVVLSADEAFLQTMREAVGEDRRLWHVLSSDKVSDLLIAGEVGIVVLDTQALSESAGVFIGQIKRQFPDLVVVVAGNRGDENALASLISEGTVYRFIHKPMSPARAKLFAEAAVRKYGERQRISRFPTADNPPRGAHRRLIGSACGAALLLTAAVTWIVHQSSREDAGPLKTNSAGRPGESELMAKAAAALAANRLTEPSGDNALELYLRAQARNPADPAARAGLTEVHERLLARAENALLEERLDEATAAIETARKAGVESGRIAFLSAQLNKLRELVKSPQNRPRADSKTDEEKIKALLGLASGQVEAGHLIAPPEESARDYVMQALRLDPDNSDVLDAKRALALRLLAEARAAIVQRDFSGAAHWIEGAKGIAADANIESVESLLDTARNQVASSP
jgi:hypothetical protein